MIAPARSATESGLIAVRSALARIDGAAASVARATTKDGGLAAVGPPDVIGALVEMTRARHDLAAGAATIRRSGEARDALLDIFV